MLKNTTPQQWVVLASYCTFCPSPSSDTHLQAIMTKAELEVDAVEVCGVDHAADTMCHEAVALGTSWGMVWGILDSRYMVL